MGLTYIAKVFVKMFPLPFKITYFHYPFTYSPLKALKWYLAWNGSLGTITVDFSIPSISFDYNNNQITLQGDPRTSPTPAAFHHLRHLLHTNAIASLHLLSILPTNPSPTVPRKTHLTQALTPYTEVQQLLSTYPTVFQEPKGLPPLRPHDHHIPLLPNTPPINIKPYRYPHAQKDTMTTIIREMLHDGTIIPSTNPYSSPVLLIRKKDGT